MKPRPVDGERVRFSPGQGLDVASEDGDFRLRLRVRGQFRYTVRSTQEGEVGQQLRIRRARVVFKGHFFGEHNRFKLELAVSPNDLGVADNLGNDGSSVPTFSPLLDLYLDLTHLRDLSLRVGQYKLPSNRQRVISSGDLQLVDRSLLNAEFTLDRDVGLDVRSKDLFGLDLLKYYAGLSIGRGRDSQGFDDFGINYFLRVELLPFGDFSDYTEADLSRDPAPRLSLGAAYAHQDENRGLRRISSLRPEDGGTVDQHVVYADLIFKCAGFSAQSEFAWRRGSRNPGDATLDDGRPAPVTLPRNGWGMMAQVGYMVEGVPMEVAGRYGTVRGDDEGSSLEDRSEVGAGISWYIGGHAYKLQGDAFRLWSDVMARGETRVRIQLQGSL